MSFSNLFMPKKIGITGSTGFLGSNFILKLINSDEFSKVDKITAFYSNTRWNPLLLDIKSEKLEYKKLDILDFEKCLESTKNLDCIVHFAAFVSFSKKDLEKLWKINVEGTENILKAAIENKVKRFILISSVSILDHSNDRKILTEKDIGVYSSKEGAKNFHSYQSISQILEYNQRWKNNDKSFLKNIKLPYHDTKLASYVIAKETVRGKDIELITILPGTVIGKGDNHYSITKLVDRVYKNSLLFTMPGNASFVHVEDLSNGIYLAMLKGKKDEDYIITGNIEQNLPYKFFMKTIAKKLNLITKKRYFSSFLTIPYSLALFAVRLMEAIYPNTPVTEEMIISGYSKCSVSIEKAATEIGYKVEKSFEEAVEDLCKDFIDRDISKYEVHKKHFFIIRNVICEPWIKKNCKVIVNYDKGIENCPRRVYIVHHPSTYDFFTLTTLAKNNFYLPINKEAFDVPIVGYFLYKSGFLPVYIGKNKKIDIISPMVKKAKNGYPILNSARNEEFNKGVRGKLRTGGIVIADLAKADIIPIHIYIEKGKIYEYNVIKFNLKKAPATYFKNALVFVSFLKPIKWEEYHKENMTKDDYYKIIENIGEIFDKEDEKIERQLIENKSYYDLIERKGGPNIFVNY